MSIAQPNLTVFQSYHLKFFSYYDVCFKISMAAVIPSVTKLSSRVIRLLGCNPGPMTLQGTNTYIVGTGNRRILIDTGDPGVPQYLKNLKEVLCNENINLSHILLTHWHHDHVGGVNDIFNEIKDKTENCRVFKFPREAEDCSQTVKLESVQDGEEFCVEGATLRVLHTPGHTTDHVVLHLQEENAVFSGDCILGEGTTVFEDLYDYMNSLNIILGVKPKILYPGHGNIVKNPEEKINFYIQHRLEREQQIMDVLSSNKEHLHSVTELVIKIYTDISENLVSAAKANVTHHLAKLLKDGKVEQKEDFWKYNTERKTV